MLMMQRDQASRRAPRRRQPGDYRDLTDFLNAEAPLHGVTSSHQLGKFIGMSQGTALRLLKGEQRPKETTLRKIADAFEVDITYVRELAHRPPGERRRFTWPTEFDQLSHRQKVALIEVGRTFLDEC
jgi:transcriptional regulator with XRE-family HTH domain